MTFLRFLTIVLDVTACYVILKTLLEKVLVSNKHIVLAICGLVLCILSIVCIVFSSKYNF
jgi:hypothetical protein